MCLGLKDGGLNIDLRNLNKVKLISDSKISPSGKNKYIQYFNRTFVQFSSANSFLKLQNFVLP